MECFFEIVESASRWDIGSISAFALFIFLRSQSNEELRKPQLITVRLTNAKRDCRTKRYRSDVHAQQFYDVDICNFGCKSQNK